MRMWDATLCASGFLDLIGQGYPSLRHAKQRSLAPGLCKLSSDLDAINSVQPIRYDFAGRHPPSPDVGISRTTAVCSSVAKKKLRATQDLMSVACKPHSMIIF